MAPDAPVSGRLVGQETALRVLAASIASDRVAGAYLLHGPAGVGRSIGAEIFASTLLCAEPRGAAACLTCRACRAMAAGTHPDFLVLSAETGPFFKDDGEAERARLDSFTLAARRAAKRGARRTIPVRTIRRALEFVSLAPALGGRKIALFDSFDEVEDAGTGTLLKCFEEAPRGATFLVLAGSVESVPDTILSRCQRVRFRPLEPAVVRRLLAGHPAAESLDPAARELLVRLAQGSIGRAVRAAELGVHEGGAAAAAALVGTGDPAACDAAALWIGGGGRELAEARERLREMIALALILASGRAADAGSSDGLDAWLPAFRGALESVEANVSPDLVLRALWARGVRARALTT